jgi:hypothetical protein
VIYVNLVDNKVLISSPLEWSYKIDIGNQIKPFLIEEPLMMYLILSGNFSRLAIGINNEKNIFSKERALYFYDTSLSKNDTKKIKFFNIDKNNEVLQYEFDSKLFAIDSLWSYQNKLFVIGDNKIHIFSKENNKMKLNSIYNKREIRGNIIGIEEDILYILFNKKLTLINIVENPKFIEKINIPLNYKLGVKINGKYITTGSEIIDITTLRISNKR